MSDDQVLDVVDDVVEGEQQEPEQKQEKSSFSLEDWQHAQEEKASSSGWKPFDEYVAGGGDPTTWKTADAFNVYGEMVGTLKRTKQDFERRIEGVHKLSQAQLAAERARLLAERDTAIDDGDKTKVHALDKQINNLNVPAPQSNSELDEWNQKNPWIFEDSPKTDRAHSIFTRSVNAGRSVSEAIAAVEADIAKHFSPKPQQQRAHIPESEKGRGSAGFGKGKSAPLSMSDLTREEQQAFHHLRDAWKDEKEFLQAVADDRKAAARG